MALPRTRTKFGGDFLVPSFYGNFERAPRRVQSRKFRKNSTKENSECSVSSVEINNSRRCSYQKQKENSVSRIPLQDKNIGDNAYLAQTRSFRVFQSARASSQHEDQDEPMETARNPSDCDIEALREKCISLNLEFDDLRERHGDCLAKQTSSQTSDIDEANYTDSSDNGLGRKYTEIFEQSSKRIASMNTKQHAEEKISENKEKTCKNKQSSNKDLQLILKTLRKFIKSTPVASESTSEMAKMFKIVNSLKEEHEKFRNLINSQQNQLDIFQAKYIKAENVIKSQKHEIQQLNHTNGQIKSELNSNINDLKIKLQEKVNEALHLTQAMKTEKVKAEKLSKQNCELIARLQEVKHEVALTRARLVEATQKRSGIVNKLKATEKDLKIFRNQNNNLKTEKRNLIEELKKMNSLNDELTKKCSKNLSRQKERGESQQRQLQKKILDLELELTRSRNSTSDLIEERDKLIAELHQQLNTVVHNFEVSQKHIRVLRKHIHSLSEKSAIPQKV